MACALFQQWVLCVLSCPRIFSLTCPEVAQNKTQDPCLSPSTTEKNKGVFKESLLYLSLLKKKKKQISATGSFPTSPIRQPDAEGQAC